MSLLSPPISSYTDFFEQGKFNFLWKLLLFCSLILGFLTVFHLYESDKNAILSGTGFIIVIISLISLKITKKYVLAAILTGIVGTLIQQYDLFYIVNSQKYVTVMWMVGITLYVFYLLGSRWGSLILIANITGVTLSLYIVDKQTQIDAINSLDGHGTISIILNLLIILIIIIYLMNQIAQTSKTAILNSSEAQTELRKQYLIVQTQNEEKTVMLKEIHHRVKNNLQVITSLLRLQSAEIEDKKVVEHFDDSIQRVLAMASIHEQMYQSKDLSKIDLKGYLNTLIEELIESYAVHKLINVDIKCDIEYIQPKSLVSFALMFNELISNTLKHAFDQKSTGKITIKISLKDKNLIEAIYSDNGNWKKPTRKGSFGLELISDLCEQMDGTYEQSFENGTTYRFTFEYLNLE
jgi:two-component sensor histidine kinase